ncbi:hypothetical protein SDC9_130519 [bioreactor metagenome]|uniref:Uncharacterized protein n=1 Tax=bioreactor metagenome TaxID=1076179 RepID=A0A645D2Q5_9ZZZZ
MPDAGRHAPGRAGGTPQPPRQEGRRRDPGLGADPAGRAAGARPDRQCAQALPRRAGVLPARPRPGPARCARPAARQRDAQRRPAAGARGRRGGAAEQLSALAAVRVRSGCRQAPVVHPAHVRATCGEPGAGLGPQPGHGASGHHVLQPRRRADHLRSVEPPRPADERASVPVRPHGFGQERDAQQHPESGDGDLSAAPVHRRGGQQLRPVRRLRRTAGSHRASGEARARRGRQSGSVRRRLAPGRYAEPGTDAGR